MLHGFPGSDGLAVTSIVANGLIWQEKHGGYLLFVGENEIYFIK